MMKLNALYAKKALRLFITLSILLSFTKSFAQQSLVNVNGWNAYVHLPWDYYANPNATYPTIIFFPGTGEVGSNASLVIKNGPGAYIEQGWNGNVKIGTDSVKFIVISLQPSALWPIEIYTDMRIQTLKKMYRIDNQRLHLTGLSMGGWCATTYVTADKYGGPYTYASQIATVVEVEGVRPDDNQPYPNLFDNFAKSGGRLLGFEQINDGRDIQTRVNRMNYTRANSGIFVSTSYGSGGHCCWEQFYGGSGNSPNKFLLDGVNQNIYEWMARNPSPVFAYSNAAPVVDAGSDQTITWPINTVSLVGSASDPDGTIASYSWAKISGPGSGSIVNSSLSTAVIINLVPGTYQYELEVTDNQGAVATDTVQVIMQSLVNISPIADAGPDLVISLPTNTATLYGSGTDSDGSISSYQWTERSGPSNAKISNPTSPATDVSQLVAGTYIFDLVVTDNSGASNANAMQLTVLAASPESNKAPIANAGSDITISSGTSTATLDGSGTDSDGTVTAYFWTQASGPGAKISAPNSPSTSVSNLTSVGTYIFTLTVTDNKGATGSDNVAITVNAAAAAIPPTTSGKRKLIPVAPDGGIYFFNNNYLQPGDTGCIQAGTYPYISLSGIVGNASKPITIINCGGQVINTGNNGQSYCYRIVNSRYFKFTGTGAPGIMYGFKANWKGGFTGVGLSVKDSTSDYEVDHFEAQNVQNGFLCKIDPYNCDPGTWSTGWTIKNISFHDNYVHNTIGEGYYIINTSATVTVNDCTGKSITVEPVKAIGVKVYNNISDSTGWDGIQVAASTNAEIYNNRVTNYGMTNLNSQQAGIILGGKSNGSVYDNYIGNGTGEGLEIFGTGSIYIYNNVIANAGWDGSSSKQDAIAVDDRPQPYNLYGGLQVFVLNNTIVNAARNAVHLFNSYGSMAGGNRVNNNLLVKPNNTSPYDNPYVNVDGKTVVDTTKNVRLPVISTAAFVNSTANDYHILKASPAIDKGLNAATYGVTTDFDGISRPQGGAYDAGAFEYNLGTAPPPAGNQSPVANAGGNVTVQLPVNQVSLDGTQSSDPDGSITSYKWIVISGPSGSSISTSTKDTARLFFTSAGTYTVRLTITDNGGLSATADVIITVLGSQVVAPPSTNGKAIHVNIYDGKTPYNNSQWNNWDVNASLTSSKFTYDDNSSSGVYAYLSGQLRIINNGSNYSSTATTCPPQVLQYNSLTTSDRDLTIYGLDNSKQYRVELYASRAVAINDTRFVIGNISDTISVAYNVDDFAKFDNVTPSGGRISVSIQRLGTWQYIAGFSVIEQNSNSGLLSTAAFNPGMNTGVAEESASNVNALENVAGEKTLNLDFIGFHNGNLTLKLNSGKQQTMNLQVIDVSGRTFLKANIILQKGYNTVDKFTPGITKGIYYIKLITADNFIVKPVLSRTK
ncbi:MAG: PKD domain-containing protein [Ginsengibacter sp.]